MRTNFFAIAFALASTGAFAEGTIKSGHVLGNGTGSERTATDTPVITILQQSGSGLGANLGTALAQPLSGSGALVGAASPITTGLAYHAITPSVPYPNGTLGFVPIARSTYIPSDNVASAVAGTSGGQHIPVYDDLEIVFGGSNINHGRNGRNTFLTFLSPTASGNQYKFYVGDHSYVQALASDGVCCGTIDGVFEGITSEVWANVTSATGGSPAYFGALLPGEFAVAATAHNIAQIKSILTTTEWAQDQEHGVQVDSHIWSTANSGALGLNTWAQIDAIGGNKPLTTTATLVKVQNSGGFTTIGAGIDFTNLTVSGNVLQWANGAYYLSGGGNASFGFTQTGIVKITNQYTSGTIPACNAGNFGLLSIVTDAAAAPAWHSTYAGGGSTKALVFCNGTNNTVADY